MSGIKRVIVAGGGVGGLAASIGLANAGVQVELVEKALARDGHAGNGLVLTPNGMKALTALSSGATGGIAEDVIAAGVPSGPGHHSAFLSARGKTLAAMSLAEVPRVFGVPSVSITRARLREVLARHAEAAGVTLRYGTAVSGVQADSSSDHVGVTLDSGRVLEADALVGADGVRSTVRQLLLGGSQPRYCGYTAVYGFAPAAADHSYGFLAAGRGLQLFASLVAPDRLYWVATITAPADTWTLKTSAQAHADLLSLLERWAPRLRAVVEAGVDEPDASVIVSDVYDLDPIDTWHRGRVVLLGDAAHAMAPTLGQGVNSALEDAAVLAHYVPGVDDPFRAYTADRAPRTKQMVRQARRMSRLGQTASPVGAWLRDRMMTVAGRFTGPDKPNDWLLGWQPPTPDR